MAGTVGRGRGGEHLPAGGLLSLCGLDWDATLQLDRLWGSMGIYGAVAAHRCVFVWSCVGVQAWLG